MRTAGRSKASMSTSWSTRPATIPDAEQSILYPSEVELGETVRSITAQIERREPARVVFDSLSEMRLLAQDPLRYRRQILALKHFFADAPVHRAAARRQDVRARRPAAAQHRRTASSAWSR